MPVIALIGILFPASMPLNLKKEGAIWNTAAIERYRTTYYLTTLTDSPASIYKIVKSRVFSVFQRQHKNDHPKA